MSYFSKFYEKKKSKLKGNKFIERVNGLRQNNKKAFAMSSIAAMLLVPVISILIYKVISEPFYVKKIVSETVAEAISDQPVFMVKTLVKEDGLSDQERKELLNQMTDKMNKENQPITNDLELLKTDLLYLKDQPIQVPGNQVTNINFEELLEKIQAGTATKEDIEALLSMIEYLKSSLGTKAEQEELENLRLLLEKMQNGTVTETDLTEVKDSLGALKEEIDKIKEEMSKGLEQSNSGLEEKINKITIRIDELEKAISDNHYTKDEMDVIIGDINLAIDDINHNSLVEINTKIDEINNKTLVEINTAINNIKNETLTTINSKLEEITNNITNSNAGMKDEIDKVIDKINDLEIAIANNIYTKDEIDVMVTSINLAIDDINNNSLVKISEDIDDIKNNLLLKINKNIGNLDLLNSTNKTSLVDAMNEVFQSVSDGKKLVAAAITGKGVNTAADDTFQKMAKNIEGLVTMSSDPNVLFNVTSWTAPQDCIAVMSFNVSMECNSDYDKVALVRLNGVKDWTFGWGGNSSSDSGWHTRGTSGNVTWEAKKGVTYSLSFDPHYSGSGKGNVLTWGWGSTTWIVPKTKGIRSKAVPDNYFFQNVVKMDIKEEKISVEEPKEEVITEEKTKESNAEESSIEESSTEESNTEESSTEENTEERNTEESTEESTQESTMESQVLPNKLVASN